MKRYTHTLLFSCLFALLVAGSAYGQEDPMQDPRTGQLMESYERAIELLQNRRYDEAIAIYADALQKLDSYGWLPDEMRAELRQLAHYNTACGYALKGETKKALQHFETSLEYGFDDFDHIAEDSDLDSIRNEEAFKAAVRRYRDGAPRRRQADEALARAQAEIVGRIGKDALFPFSFDLETVDGQRVKLEDLKGKVVLVDVWGTWCPPCRKAIPHLVELQKKYGEKGLQVVGLNWEHVGADEAKPTVLAFRKENGIEYPCALAPRAIIDSIPNFQGFPTMLFVDREGRVRLKQVGYAPGEVLEAAVVKLLEEGAAKAPEKAKPAPDGGTLF